MDSEAGIPYASRAAMTPVEFFPPLNATLNAVSGVLLFTAWRFIRRGNVAVHRRLMLSACATSVLFLISYVTYHSLRGGIVTRFAGTGGWKTVYLSILLTHTVLAVAVLPLAIASVYNGLKMRVQQHRRVARWTFPIWMYVSVTGVLVYFFLYHWFPSH
jgi:putative membrane protein